MALQKRDALAHNSAIMACQTIIAARWTAWTGNPLCHVGMPGTRQPCTTERRIARGFFIGCGLRSGKSRWQTLTLETTTFSTPARYPEGVHWSDWRAARLEKMELTPAYIEAAPQLLKDRVEIGAQAAGCAP